MEHLEHSAMEEELNKLEYGKRNYLHKDSQDLKKKSNVF